MQYTLHLYNLFIADIEIIDVKIQFRKQIYFNKLNII